jgi:hypothetical protein
MFDGERCLLCNNHFKFEELTLGPGGFSLCRNCAPKVDPNEPTRLCPRDGSRMTKELIENLVYIDRCKSCGGFWFDKNEINVIRQIVKHTSNHDLARNLMWLMLIGAA